MKYFFIPGRLEELSLEELKSVCTVILKRNFHINSKDTEVHLLETEADESSVGRIFNRLGGYIKYGKIIEDQESFLQEFASKCTKKITFGVSSYNSNLKFRDLSKLSNNLKKYFRSQEVKAVFIEGEDGVLRAPQIKYHHILENGFELNIFAGEDAPLAGITLGIQDIDAFAKRDYQRPYVDKEMGVLPPKLARIMINLAELPVGSTIWDPFCGSGTILMEGLLLGYNVIGSDIDSNAVEYSKENIKWLAKDHNFGNLGFNVFKHDVLKYDKSLQNKLRTSTVDAVIFEPYMGPPQRRILRVSKATTLLENIEAMYKSLFSFIEFINQRKLKVVGVLPNYKTDDGWATIRYNSFMSKKWDMVNRNKALHFKRSHSIIMREIFIAQLKK